MRGTERSKAREPYTRKKARAWIVTALVLMACTMAGSAFAQAAPRAADASAAASAPSAPPAPAPVLNPNREWLKAVYEKVADSVVLIETETGTGSGFFFHDPRLVATALHVVDDAETIVISTIKGRRSLGRVVAYSRDYDVALVELEHQMPDARVLPAYDGEVEIGEIVAVIGHPFSGLEHQLPQLRGLLNWSLTQGVVSAVAGSWVQTDAAINPGNSGGPVLNARGEVIGVVSAKLTDAQGIGMIARIKRVQALVSNIGRQGPPRRAVAFDGVELGFLINWHEDDQIDGLAVGAGIRVMKRYPVRLRLGFIGGDITPTSPTIVASRLERFSTEVTWGYAIPFGRFFELSPTLGAALFYDRLEDSALRVDNTVACVDPPCLIEGKVIKSTDNEFRFLPSVGASLDFAHLRVAYAYQIDLSDIDTSEHRLLFALNF